jgi:hypothetical protein
MDEIVSLLRAHSGFFQRADGKRIRSTVVAVAIPWVRHIDDLRPFC